MPDLPTFDDVLDAARVLDGVAHRTPVVTSRRLNERLGCELFLKCENFQRAGAFKFRGAYNTLTRLTPEERRRGVIAASSGNHAQGVALAGRLLDVPRSIYMPADSPRVKVEATRGYGATIVEFDRYRENGPAVAGAAAEATGATFVSAFDHPHVIAGQGTATLELVDEVPDLDVLLYPVGGGGLISGAALVAEARLPTAELWGVEPVAAADGLESLATGTLVSRMPGVTIADGAQTPSLGERTFAIIRRRVAGIITATDEELILWLQTMAAIAKMVVEPTSCLPLAGLERERERFSGRRVGVVISGGNIDLGTYARLLSTGSS